MTSTTATSSLPNPAAFNVKVISPYKARNHSEISVELGQILTVVSNLSKKAWLSVPTPDGRSLLLPSNNVVTLEEDQQTKPQCHQPRSERKQSTTAVQDKETQEKLIQPVRKSSVPLEWNLLAREVEGEIQQPVGNVGETPRTWRRIEPKTSDLDVPSVSSEVYVQVAQNQVSTSPSRRGSSTGFIPYRTLSRSASQSGQHFPSNIVILSGPHSPSASPSALRAPATEKLVGRSLSLKATSTGRMEIREKIPKMDITEVFSDKGSSGTGSGGREKSSPPKPLEQLRGISEPLLPYRISDITRRSMLEELGETVHDVDSQRQEKAETKVPEQTHTSPPDEQNHQNINTEVRPHSDSKTGQETKPISVDLRLHSSDKSSDGVKYSSREKPKDLYENTRVHSRKMSTEGRQMIAVKPNGDSKSKELPDSHARSSSDGKSEEKEAQEPIVHDEEKLRPHRKNHRELIRNLSAPRILRMTNSSSVTPYPHPSNLSLSSGMSVRYYTDSVSEEESQALEDLVSKKLIKQPSGLVIKDRKWHTKTFKLCFVGKELVDWLIFNGWASNRDEGVIVGKKLLSLGLVEQLTGEGTFKDEFLYYRFPKHVIVPARKKTKDRQKGKKRLAKGNSVDTIKATLPTNVVVPSPPPPKPHLHPVGILTQPADSFPKKATTGVGLLTPYRQMLIEEKSNVTTPNVTEKIRRKSAPKPQHAIMEKRVSVKEIKKPSVTSSSGSERPSPKAKKGKQPVEKNLMNKTQKKRLQKALKKCNKEREKKAKEKEIKLLQHLNVLLEQGRKLEGTPPSPELHFVPAPPLLPPL